MGRARDMGASEVRILPHARRGHAPGREDVTRHRAGPEARRGRLDPLQAGAKERPMSLFTRRSVPALVGVLHLPPLPGAPRGHGPLDAVVRRAAADARALAEAGFDGVIVENLGDAPFTAGRVDAAVVACMTRVALAVREAAPGLPLGINVLRNDGLSALGVAAAVDAAFIRVNVLTGAMVTDQGLIEGEARALLLERRRLGLTPQGDHGVRVAADVLVKHATPLGQPRREDVARDAWGRGGADALIVSGAGTGLPTDPAHLDAVRDAAPSAPIWLGSGFHPDRAAALRGRVDVAIIGTFLHAADDLDAPLDADRLHQARVALRG
jgi:hypothetical protein